jgi:hypothetical protein
MKTVNFTLKSALTSILVLCINCSFLNASVLAPPDETVIDCGAEEWWFLELNEFTINLPDTASFLALLTKKALKAAEQGGYSCAGCDDPGYVGCELELELLFTDDIEYTADEEGNFSLTNGDLVANISCSLCSQPDEDEIAESEADSGTSTDAPSSDFHNLEQQTYCGETNFFHASIQGLMLEVETWEEVYAILRKILDDNHASFGFGCKLCPDGTKRCELTVLGFWQYSSINQLGWEYIVIEETDDGYKVPAQEIWVKYLCSDCDEEVDDSSDSDDTLGGSDDGTGGIDDTDEDGTSDGDETLETDDENGCECPWDADCDCISDLAPNQDSMQLSKISHDTMMNEALASVECFPNPISDEINIRSSSEIGSSQILLELYDLSGKLIFQELVTAEKLRATFQLDSSSLGNGIYLLTLTDGLTGKKSTTRLIK